MSGRSCAEGSMFFVPRLVCAHFVSDILLQILADVWQMFDRSWQMSADVLHQLNRRVGPCFAMLGSKVAAKSMEQS